MVDYRDARAAIAWIKATRPSWCVRDSADRSIEVTEPSEDLATFAAGHPEVSLVKAPQDEITALASEMTTGTAFAPCHTVGHLDATRAGSMVGTLGVHYRQVDAALDWIKATRPAWFSRDARAS